MAQIALEKADDHLGIDRGQHLEALVVVRVGRQQRRPGANGSAGAETETSPRCARVLGIDEVGDDRRVEPEIARCLAIRRKSPIIHAPSRCWPLGDEGCDDRPERRIVWQTRVT